MNLVYPLKSKSRQLEIKYSLKTVEKFLRGYKDIYVLGTEPVPNTIFIEHPDPHPRPTGNSYLKCRKACELMERFLWMNDDIYFTKPIHVEDIPLIHKGPLPPHDSKSANDYQGEIRHTQKHLLDAGLPTNSYEVHAPMPIVSEVFLRVTSPELCAGNRIVLWRSLYGNACGFPSVKMPDNKIYGHKNCRLEDALKPFFVSSAEKFHPVLLQWLRGLK